jgi:hypothetical protein
MGGLGNQLFQYAAGRALSLKHKVPLKIDTTFYHSTVKENVTKRGFELDLFKINADVASQEELDLFIHRSFFKKIMKRLFPSSGYFYAEEKKQNSVNDFSNYGDNIYLDGYWQSEKYFKDIRTTLLNELNLKKEIPETCLPVIEQIKSTTSVSIHIRRGDYISNEIISPNYCNVPVEYYHKAIETVKKQHPAITVFVFSDDMEWVKINLKLPEQCVYIDFNTGENNVFDMYLMSLCKHNVIANSSFSWWGAWLNQYPDKIVIAPENWYAKKELINNDLIPDTWLQL